MSIFVSYSSKNIEHVAALDSENRSENNHELWIAYQKNEKQKKNVPTGEEFKPEIIKAIRNSDSAILLVSNNYLNASFVVDYELPEIFKKREENSEYKIIPIFVEQIDSFSRYPELENLQYINSPNTNLESLSGNKYRLVLRDTIGEVAKSSSILNRLIKRNVNKYLLPLSLSMLIGIGLFFTTTLRNTVPAETYYPEESRLGIEFTDLEIGDCYIENEPVNLLMTRLKDSNLSYAYMQNPVPDDLVELVDCNTPHDYEVAYKYNSEISDNEYEKLYSNALEICFDRSKLYIGRKHQVANSDFDAMTLPQWKTGEDQITNVYCLIGTYADTKIDETTSSQKHIRTSNKFGNFNLLSEFAIYEKDFLELSTGECFNEPGIWNYRSIERKINSDNSKEGRFGKYLDGWDSTLEIVNCKNPHDYELIGEHIFTQEDDKLFLNHWKLGVGVTQDFEFIEKSSIDKFLLDSNMGLKVEVINFEDTTTNSNIKKGDVIYSLNGYSMNKGKQFSAALFALKDEDEIFLEVNGIDSKYGDSRLNKLVTIEDKPYVPFSDRNLILNAEDVCKKNVLLFQGTDLYTSVNENSSFENDFVIKEELIQGTTQYRIYCMIQYMEKYEYDELDYILAEGVEIGDVEKSRTKFTGSFKNSYFDRYEGKGLKAVLLESASSIVKKYKDLKSGDCLRQLSTNYKDIQSSEDKIVISTDCTRHSSQVITLKELSMNEYSYKSTNFIEMAKDFCYASMKENYRSSELMHGGLYRDDRGFEKSYESTTSTRFIENLENNTITILCTYWISGNGVTDLNNESIGYRFLPWSLEENKSVDLDNRLYLEFGFCPEYIEVDYEHDGYIMDFFIIYKNVESRITSFIFEAEDSGGAINWDMLQESATPEFYSWYISNDENIPIYEYSESFFLFDRINGAAFDSIIWDGKPGETGYMKVVAEDAAGNKSEAECSFPFIQSSN
jgi:hypothetical protein